MRKCFMLLLCAFLASCFAADNDVSNVGVKENADQRYVLALYTTPTMTYSTAKSCYKLGKLSESEIKEMPGAMGKVFGQYLKPYWRFLVDIGSESDASKKDVLINGEFVESSVEPSFSLSGTMFDKGEQCGFVTGRALTSSGFINVSDLLNVSDEVEDVELDTEQSLGVFIIGQAAEDVYSSNQDMIIDCAAVMRAALPLGGEPDVNYLLWFSLLSDFISENDVSPLTLSDSSATLKLLVDGMGGVELPYEGIDEDLKSSCVEVADAAIEKAQAGVQK